MPPKRMKAEPIARQSARLGAQQFSRPGIDEAAKRRRIQRQMETLEKDNFQEDPHANITWHKAAPRFEDELVFGDPGPDGKRGRKRKKPSSPSKVSGAEQATKRGKKLVASFTKTRFRKSFVQLAEEYERKCEEELKTAAGGRQREREDSAIPVLTYSQIAAPPSRLPPRKFCAVCGLRACYTCVKCAARYCSIPCRDTHKDTRCQKWTI